MSVLVIPGDTGGCGAYRLRFPAEAVRDVGGVDVAIIDADDVPMPYLGQPDRDGTVRVISIDTSGLPDVDTVVMQRPLQDTGWQFVRLLRRAGYRVVVDVDDDFDRLHPGNPAARLCAADARYSPVNIHRAIGEADACTVSTPALADRYRRDGTPVTVLRNLVPASYLDVPSRRDARTVGWAGSVTVHHNDLGVLGGVLGGLQRDGWTVKVIGRASRVELGCVTDPVVVPWLPLVEFPFEVASLGVGVVPLRDTAFNAGKSWLKGLEYAALGVPFAASPTVAYRELAGLGLGVLVEKPRMWRRSILVAADGGDGRGVVRSAGLTYQDRWRDWAAIWQP